MKTKINTLFILFALLFAGCEKGAWENYQPPVDPTAQNPDPDPEPDPEGPDEGDESIFRVVSIGINNQNADYTALVELINTNNADLVVLREVDKNNTRTGVDINQAEVIAEDTDMQYVFAPQLDNYREGQFGLAVLSKWPIEESWVDKLPIASGQSGDQRPIAYIKVNYKEEQPIAFFGLHLDDTSNANRRKANKESQTNKLIEYLREVDIPAFIAGNFFFQNDGDDRISPTLLDLADSPCIACMPTVNQHGEDFIADHVLFMNIGSERLVDYTIGEEIGSRKPAIASFRLTEAE